MKDRAPLGSVVSHEDEGFARPPGKQTLVEPPLPQRQTPAVVQRKEDGLTARMPKQLDLKSASVSVTLPGGRMLYRGDADLSTRNAATVTLTATADSVRLSVSPAIFVDATWPAKNMNLHGLAYWFASGQTEVHLGEGPGHGFLDYSDKARAAFTAQLTGAIAGTNLARRDYNPLADGDLAGTLAQVAAKFQSMPGAPGGAPAGAGDLGRVAVGGTFAAKTQIVAGGSDGQITIPAGGEISVFAQGAGNVADVAAGGSAQGRAAAAHLESIRITSESIVLSARGKPVAKLQDLQVARGGAVSVGRLETMGTAKTLEGLEALVRLIGAAVYASAHGAPDNFAFAYGAQNANPEIIPGLTREMIEKGLTDAVRKLVRDNAGAIPGLNLADILGVEGQ